MQYAAERTHHTDGEAEREALRNSVRAANERADAAVSAALHLQVSPVRVRGRVGVGVGVRVGAVSAACTCR